MNLKINPVSFQEIADPESLSLLGKIGRGIVLLYQAIKENKVQFPKRMEVSGDVGITHLPAIKIDNFHDLGSYFSSLEKRIGSLAQAIQSVRIENTIEADKECMRIVSKNLASLEKALLSMKGSEKESVSSPTMSDEDSRALQGIESAIKNLYTFETEKPTFVPPAVTHVSLNALSGVIKTTSATVSTTPIGLPTYGVLSNRRSIVIYNNDSTTTLYYGGSEVSTSNGLPVPPNSYSTILDLGTSVVPYAVVASGSVNVRVMEVSDAAAGR